jgi:hypothetical protein
MVFIIQTDSDDFNTHGSQIQIEKIADTINIKLEKPDREISIAVSDFDQLCAAINV